MVINKLKIDGICLFEQFAAQLDNKQRKSMSFILSRIEYISHNPVELDRKICERIYERKGGMAIGCVFKEKDLRVYCLYSLNAISIVMGGLKQNSANDTRHLIEIASEIRQNQANTEKVVVILKSMTL